MTTRNPIMPNAFHRSKAKFGFLPSNLPQAAKSYSKDGTMAIWKKRQSHMYSTIKNYPRRLRKDAEDLVKVFFWRKSLKLRLCDKYLMKVWECSRATVQRRLEELERLGLIRRLTFSPRNKGGRWEQLRYIFMLVSQKQTPVEQTATQSSKTEPADKSNRTPFSFEDYLAQRQDVPLRSFLFWMRRWNASPRSMGYIKTVWKKISKRADILESIIWCAKEENLQGQHRVGFIINEIQVRT